MIEPLSGKHLYITIRSNMISFYQSLSRSNKQIVQSMYASCKQHLLSITGRNIRNIMDMSCKDDFVGTNIKFEYISTGRFKKNHYFEQLNSDELWKPQFIKDLICLKRSKCITTNNDHVQGELTLEEINLMINDICTN